MSTQGSSSQEQAPPSGIQDSGRPTLLYFYSPRSGRCRRVDGFLAQVLQRGHKHDSFALHRIDCDRNPDLAQRFRVDALPTLIVVEERAVRGLLSAPAGCADIEHFLAPWLQRPSS